MRIGVDAVLLGAWSCVEGNHILDVGTGCGVIALMCAQRNPSGIIDAVETDVPSVREASTNFLSSPWPDRLHVIHMNYLKFQPDYKYERIISNPPYFSSGINAETSVRMHARHEGDLSPLSLLRHSRGLLKPTGTVSMIVPYLRADEIISEAKFLNFRLSRRLDVRGNHTAPLKRSLLEFTANIPAIFNNHESSDNPSASEPLTLENSPSIPTSEYRELCKDFYLYF